MLHCCRTDLLVGFRYYNLSDSVLINETPQSTNPFAMYNINDNFSARNDFYGSEIGLRTNIYRQRWSLEILTKLAIGDTHQTVNISGQTIKTTADGTTAYDAGVFALNTNSGTFQQDVFTLIPQLGLELGYQLSCHWRAYLGYNILFWGSGGAPAIRSTCRSTRATFPRILRSSPPPEFPGRPSGARHQRGFGAAILNGQVLQGIVRAGSVQADEKQPCHGEQGQGGGARGRA